MLKLLPKIVDDHEALSAFRKVFDEELAPIKTPKVLGLAIPAACVCSLGTHACLLYQDRQLKFQELVLRMWPSFIDWQTAVPASLLLNPPLASNARQRANTTLPANPSQPIAPVPRARAATDSKEPSKLPTADSRALLLSTTARGYACCSVRSCASKIITDLYPQAITLAGPAAGRRAIPHPRDRLRAAALIRSRQHFDGHGGKIVVIGGNRVHTRLQMTISANERVLYVRQGASEPFITQVAPWR